MKKVLLSGAAICGLALAASPAFAQDTGGVKLDLGGFFKGYGAYVDQDEQPGVDARSFDILRYTEIHFGGETTLDNGLTVGAHFETDADGDDGLEVQESYVYFSGGWGRVNFGAEDGAAYLLQVAAPSADENIDGIRQYIQAANYDLMGGGTTAVPTDDFADLSNSTFYGLNVVLDDNGAAGNSIGDIRGLTTIGTGAAFRFDYDQDPTGWAEKFTYLTPVFNGFQAGFSYTPKVDGDSRSVFEGVNEDDVAGDYSDAWEAALRYEGMFNNVGVALGAGYSFLSLEDEVDFAYREATGNGTFTAGVDEVIATSDDEQAWNVGVDLDFGPIGVGASYKHDDLGLDDEGDQETWVLGTDYTTGPFRLGLSYYSQDNDLPFMGELETDRYTGGVVYTYGPGMTFRGSISYIEHDVPEEIDAGEEQEATSVVIGTQINF